jgi:hypothetical protein
MTLIIMAATYVTAPATTIIEAATTKTTTAMPRCSIK